MRVQSAINAAGTTGCVTITPLTTDTSNWYNPSGLTIVDQRPTTRVGEFLGGASVTPKLANFAAGSVANKKIMYLGNSTVWNASAWFWTMAAQDISGGILAGMNIHQDVQSLSADSSGNVTVVLGSPSGFTVGQFVSLIVTVSTLDQCQGSGIVTAVSGDQFTFTGTESSAGCVNVVSTPTQGMATQQLLNFGNNGATLASMLANTSTTSTGIGGICAVKPDLLIIRGPLINDVRTGTTNLAQAEAMERQLLDTVRSCSPNTDILLKTETSLLTTNVGGYNYVTPNSSAQAYSTILEQAVTAFTNVYPHVFVLDTQESLFGTTSPATSAYMSDQLHPSAAGQTAEAKEDIQVLTQLMNNGFQSVGTVDPNNPNPVPFSPYLAQDARANSYTQPWTFYPQACADPNYYTLVAQGTSLESTAAGQTYLDLSWPSAAWPVIQNSDIVQQQSAGCWQLTGSPSGGADGANTRIYLTGQTTPYATNANEQINIWRPIYILQAAEGYVKNTTTYPYRHRVYIGAGGSGYFDISFEPSERISAANSDIQTSDILILNASSTVSMSGCSFGVQGPALRCFISGNQASLAGQYGWIFGTHPMEGQPNSNNQTLIGASRKPAYATLDVWGPDALNTSLAFLVANSASTTVFQINDNGFVGIGNTTPAYTLDVKGQAGASSPFNVASSTGLSELTVSNAGLIGIGTTSPLAKLDVAGGNNATAPLFQLSSVASFATTTEFIVNNNGSAVLAGTLTQNSDQRLKTNIQDLDASSSLAEINALNPVTFNWIDPSEGTTPQLGFIAQQVQQVFPTLVSTTSATALTPDGTLGLNYIDLISPIVAAIQGLSSEIASLESTVAGFAENFATQHFTAHDVTTQQLCVGSTCVTPTQFQAMVAAVGQPNNSSSASAPSPSEATGTPPIIQINGDNPAVIQVGASYSDLGATITGPQADLNLGIKTFLNGALVSPITLDTSAAATDTIDYVATDTWGNTATSTRTVIVQASNDNGVASTTAANDNTQTSTTTAVSQ